MSKADVLVRAKHGKHPNVQPVKRGGYPNYGMNVPLSNKRDNLRIHTAHDKMDESAKNTAKSKS